ncbi:MAG: hypothetical protein KAQ69_00465 [Spirochaetales bacterium]|nr:hypothetical protein [Spirochaetales bacterium]
MEDTRYPGIQHLIKQKIGASSVRIPSSILDSAINAIMTKWNCSSESDFLHLIKTTPDAHNDLIHNVTINETYFFRESRALDIVINLIIPDLLKTKDRITILSAGCSTGAEIYSIVMKIDAQYNTLMHNRFQYIGIDVNKRALDIAAAGSYTRHQLRGLAKPLINTYFDHDKRMEYRLKHSIKSQVSFKKINLVDTSQVSALSPCDIIFYRNVSIYFDTDQRIAVFRSLADLLHPEGTLFTSSAETIPHDLGILSLKNYQGVFVFKKDSASPTPPVNFTKRYSYGLKPGAKRVSSKKSRKDIPVVKKNNKVTIKQALEFARTGSFSKAIKLLDIIESSSGITYESKTLRAGIYFDQNNIDTAESLCNQLITEDPMKVEPHVIKAMIERLQGKYDNALSSLKSAVFIDSMCWIALYYSAEILKEQQEKSLAVRTYRRVIASLKDPVIHDYLLIVSVTEQTVKQIIRLCTYSIQQLAG